MVRLQLLNVAEASLPVISTSAPLVCDQKKKRENNKKREKREKNVQRREKGGG